MVESLLTIVMSVLLIIFFIAAVLIAIFVKPNSKYFNDVNFEITHNDSIRSIINILYYSLIMLVAVGLISTIFIAIWLTKNGYSYNMILETSPEYNEDVYNQMLNALNAPLELAVYMLALIPIVIISFRWIKDDIKNFKKTYIKWIFLGFILLYVVSYVVSIIYILIGVSSSATNQEAVEASFSGGILNIIIMCFTTIVFAPILEELVFRKSIFNLCKNNNMLGIVLSSIFFGLIHVITPASQELMYLIGGNGSMYKFVYESFYIIQYAVMGAAISTVYVLTDRNIIVTISLHMLNNLVSVILMFIFS